MADVKDEKHDNDADDPRPLEEKVVESQHEVRVNGKALTYTATAGTLVLRDHQKDKDRASIFFVAYTMDHEEEPEAPRPLLVSFNGGPGSSSVWLHLGILGPRRVDSGDVDALKGPPYALIDNEHTLLDVADLLFIDPVGTGYSRAASVDEVDQFYGIQGDAESVGDFIQLYVSRYERWGSPKFLIGESYGSTRAAALSSYLQDKHGMYLNGIMLVSSILNFQTAVFAVGNDLPFILYLPAYTATAWYHGALGEALQRQPLAHVLEEAEAFALGEYASALLQGARLPEEQRARIAAEVARLTGLSESFVKRSDLRIEYLRFAKELLRGKNRTVGRLDSRFKGIDRDSIGENFEYDPSYSAILGTYTGAMNDYLTRELGFKSDRVYEILTWLFDKWDYGEYKNKFVNVAEMLRASMTRNPKLKVLVASGYYDLATPYFASDYTLDHLALDPSLGENIETTYYEAGHMMYVHEPSLIQLSEDLHGFVGRAL